MLEVQPDAWRLNGDLATVIGSDSTGHRYLIRTVIKGANRYKKLKRTTNVLVSGKMTPLMTPTNENQHDSRIFYISKDVFNVISGDIKLYPNNCNKINHLHLLHSKRKQFLDYLNELPKPLGPYCNQLLLGESDAHLNSVIQNVKTIGIVHLFCLSGLHVEVICRILKWLLINFHITKERINILLICILPFALVVGGSGNSLTRAVLMLEIQFMTSMVIKDSLFTWSVSLFIHTLLDVFVLCSLGGQLTYLLSFCLTCIKWKSNFQRYIGINLISLPVIIHSTYQFHLISLFINFVAIPLFSFFILPGVLSSAILNNFFPELVNIFNGFLNKFNEGVRWLAQLPGLITFGRIPDIVVVILVILTIIFFETNKYLYIKFIVITYLAMFMIIHFNPIGEVTFVDIGQGDSMIVRLPFNRRVMMIDTGGQLTFKSSSNLKNSLSDCARRTSINYLKSKGIKKIDYVFLSHADVDHIGYLTSVTTDLDVQNVVVPSGMERMHKLTKRLANGVKVIPVTNQSTFLDLPIKIIHPFKKGCGKNEDSMVIQGIFGDNKFIFTGDLDRQGERNIMKEYPNLKADVIKLGHHGSRTSSDPLFIKKIEPKLAIISAGRNNRYGHPNTETLDTLKNFHIRSLSTQKYGMIKYQYFIYYNNIQTTLRGDEYQWMLKH